MWRWKKISFRGLDSCLRLHERTVKPKWISWTDERRPRGRENLQSQSIINVRELICTFFTLRYPMYRWVLVLSTGHSAYCTIRGILLSSPRTSHWLPSTKEQFIFFPFHTCKISYFIFRRIRYAHASGVGSISQRSSTNVPPHHGGHMYDKPQMKNHNKTPAPDPQM